MRWRALLPAKREQELDTALARLFEFVAFRRDLSGSAASSARRRRDRSGTTIALAPTPALNRENRDDCRGDRREIRNAGRRAGRYGKSAWRGCWR